MSWSAASGCKLHGYSGATKDDHAAELIADYRQRWNLADADDELLGPNPPANIPQRADRASLDTQLLRLERLLDRDRRDDLQVER